MPSPAATADPGRRDPVTLLLGQIWDTALDPGYATAAAAARGGPVPSRRRTVRPATVAGLVLIGLILAVALAQTRRSEPAVARQRAALETRIHEQTSQYDATTRKVTALQAQVDSLKNNELAATGEGDLLASQLAELETQAALVAVSGPGLQVTMDDAATPPPGTDPSLDRVLDRDLQVTVNGLWAAGAEAVAVNGQRLTGLSAIRSAGDAILVDYRPLTRPYVVTAIGAPSTFEADFDAGPAGRALRALQQAYGIRYTVVAVDRATLPAASTVELRYAHGKGTGP